MIDARGEFAAALATVKFIPQAWLTWNTRRDEGIWRRRDGSSRPRVSCG
jgi:hypothetical protein